MNSSCCHFGLDCNKLSANTAHTCGNSPELWFAQKMNMRSFTFELDVLVASDLSDG